MTNQPQWKTVYATDYSRLLVDETGVYVPELEINQEIHDSSEIIDCPHCKNLGIVVDDCPEYCDDGKTENGNKFEVYRVCLERYKTVTVEGALDENENETTVTHLVPFGYDENWTHPARSYVPWFDLSAVAASCGIERDELVSDLCSADPIDLARAYDAIAGYYGWHEFDQYPLTLTETELNKRWE